MHSAHIRLHVYGNTYGKGFTGDDIRIQETGVCVAPVGSQDAHIKAVLDWPEVSSEPISEASSEDYIPKAFPCLFPTGECGLKIERRKNINPVNYFRHLMRYYDGRFARHPRFRFFAYSLMRWTALRKGTLNVNKHSTIANKSGSQLKQSLLKEPRLLKQVMFYGSNLRGTSSYWKTRCYELIDMIDQLGLPTVFITFSSADFHWPDLFQLLSPEKDPLLLREKERRKLIEENPMIVDSYFTTRVKLFFSKVCILFQQIYVIIILRFFIYVYCDCYVYRINDFFFCRYLFHCLWSLTFGTV